MNILVLNGSPRPNGNTSAMVEAFTDGAGQSGHKVSVVNVCQKKIAGCLACLKKAALILSSESDHVYCGAIYEYQNSFLNYLKLEDRGIFSAYGKQNKSEEKLNELREFGKTLK